MNYSVIAYIIYLWIGVGLTLWVAHILFKNAKVFFNDIFHQNEELATSVNHLLKAGFYLINIGLVMYLLEHYSVIKNYKEMLEVLSAKVGGIVLLLGAMHFLNVYILFKLRRKATTVYTPPRVFTNNKHPHFGDRLKEIEEVTLEETA